MLRVAALEEGIKLIQNGQADVLARLLQDHGPPFGIEEAVFLDPNRPEDDLEAA